MSTNRFRRNGQKILDEVNRFLDDIDAYSTQFPFLTFSVGECRLIELAFAVAMTNPPFNQPGERREALTALIEKVQKEIYYRTTPRS